MFEDLTLIIDFVDKYYGITNDEWLTVVPIQDCVNLKKKTVSHIQTYLDIRNYIFKYIEFLPEKTVGILLESNNLNFSKSKLRSRIKTKNSVNAKIDNYLKRDNGNFPIKKCFNDLLGFRIIIDDNFSYSDINSFVSQNYPNLKCIDSSKNGYVATHIYFQAHGNNKLFPWELQIWQLSDEENNINSHTLYKQGYTTWENLTNKEE